MAEKFGEVKRLAFLKAHIFTGYNVTSTLSTKAAAPKANLVFYLEHLLKPLSKRVLHQAEEHLVKVVDLKSTCDTFDEPIYKVYTLKEKSLK